MNIPPDSIARTKSQALDSLMTSAQSVKNDDAWSTLFSALVPGVGTASPVPLSQTAATSPISAIPGLSATGRNMALPDPESAYNMMTLINKADVSYKAQSSELTQMKISVSQMQEAGKGLADTSLTGGNAKLRLLGFVGQYNNWIGKFSADLQSGGLLSGTQAAQASRFELEQNYNNRFFGVSQGLHGMNDLGVTIDPNTHLAAVNTAKLDSQLADNPSGVVDTLREFSSNFAKSAAMLVSDGNFIQKQLENLSHAIHFISDNKTSLQQEFGTGDAASPTGQIAKGLAAYNQTA
jgi:hypothetical protein